MAADERITLYLEHRRREQPSVADFTVSVGPQIARVLEVANGIPVVRKLPQMDDTPERADSQVRRDEDESQSSQAACSPLHRVRGLALGERQQVALHLGELLARQPLGKARHRRPVHPVLRDR